MISENSEKSLRDWKLPPSSASDVFGRSSSSCFFPNCRVKTVEKEIPLQKGFATFPLFSKFRKRVHQISYSCVHVGMIQVGLKPTKLGSDTSAIISLRDKRMKDPASVKGMVESSLRDGPIYFTYHPTYCVALSDSCISFCIDVEIEGVATLMYRFHYRVVKMPYLVDFSSRFPVDERGKTTLHLTDIARSNRVVSKTISWDGVGRGGGGGEGEVGSADVDWKETARAHVLKVDVPGFRREEVRVEVVGGRVLQISGERSNEEEEEEEEGGVWHCEERSGGKFLRRLRLPENAKVDEVKATVKNGVLTVTVAKEEVGLKSEVKVVDISD
ncbi:uncharacterized protein LOC131005954 [Salvia miltiorrhiza]|uniref:uncharacterized protein LOC131005954 n=1 Tax=Salvia miltiorrhiza TaxID=226208 RepID=UPI0025AD2736|nr:uncharacterized protein LOC131005954 [Salvia miltiorrhiza]